MNIQKFPSLTLESTLYTLDQLTETEANLPKIAFAGRSNVGKSSLINALAQQKNLAKTSSTPGKTQSINFFRVQPDDFYLVDLPGYGYARTSKVKRQLWGELIEHFLQTASHLNALALLIDSRIPPQQLDINLAQFSFQAKIPLLPILTKIDQCKQRERIVKQNEWTELLEGQKPLLVSSRSGYGIRELWNLLQEAGKNQ